jgi:glutamate formiminotransferase
VFDPLVQQAKIMGGEICSVAGEHPRLGAMDVCPFIPVRNVTVAECVSCAKQLGHLLPSELDVPVYLYGAASSRDYRKTVAHIRAGEYVALGNRVSWHTILRDRLYHVTFFSPVAPSGA